MVSNSYGLTVANGTSGAFLGTYIDATTNIQSKIAVKRKGFFTEMQGSSNVAFEATMTGGGVGLRINSSDIAEYLVARHIGSMIYSDTDGQWVMGNSRGVVISSYGTALVSKLTASGGGVWSETNLNYKDVHTNEKIGLHTFKKVNADSSKNNSEVYLAKEDIGIESSGDYLAGLFHGAVTIEGQLTVGSGCNGCGDLAEALTTAQLVLPGDIVATDDNLNLIKATKENRTVVGIVSADPSMTLNNAQKINGQPVALAGFVTVKVNDENGSIRPGDWITASSQAGFGMKAIEPCTVVGKSLQRLNEKSGEIKVIVDLGWYAGATCEK